VSSAESAIRDCWEALAGRKGGANATIDSLLGRHREPHRRYHTATHVMWVLRHVDEIIDDPRTPTVDADVVRAAALFHDIVYDPRSTTNEADSSVLAVEAVCSLGWTDARTEAVRILIQATAGHKPPAGPLHDAATVLLDADLAVLGAAPADYLTYVEGVRAEYSFVDDAGWRSGRGTVLQTLLDHDPLFATAHMHAAREAAARANLTAELTSLSA
jgi:predicted metal-dependent HD superfamily phosphohydrolase